MTSPGRSLSPIQSLPVELLSYIFIFTTLEDDEDGNPSFTTESIKVPHILCSVNRKWRLVAQNTRALWTNICVTSELIGTGDTDRLQTSTLDTRHLDICLKHSRNYPLDILIDARDYNWDFSEPGTSLEYGRGTYVPPFSSGQMRMALDILLPHITRWRSLAILTDTWAPLYAALQQIQPVITTIGAPILESMTLMRCNDFVSYSPTFEPQELKGPAFLTLSDTVEEPRALLPRLRKLTLRGVHVDWSGLASILSQGEHSGLHSLELSSHSVDVRPTISEFRQLLSTSPHLTKLVINGSGPRTVDENEEELISGLGRISFPCLQGVTLGYRSAHEGQILFNLIDAPKVRALTLEDVTHAGDPEIVDAGRLLGYLATGESRIQDDYDVIVAYSPSEGLYYQPEVETDDSTRQSPRVAAGKKNARLRVAFPSLESLTLKGVKCAFPEQLRTFFEALPNVQQLEMSGMTMGDLDALLPQAYDDLGPDASVDTCPCPRLQSLCIRGFEVLRAHDLAFLIRGLATARVNQGGCGLRRVDVYLDDTSGGYVTEDVIHISHVGTSVKIIRELPREYDDSDSEDDEVDCDEGCGDVDPFDDGGAFNDPVFDARYGGAFFEMRA